MFQISSDFLATGTQFSQNCIDTLLVDDTHALGGNTQTYKTVFAFYPETVPVQVRQELLATQPA